ncbi:hypothetical protein [Nonomuraea sp. JJY05]|uniref:hypothetical protein n=1 Tax=Nonomuraea sp. JJY05 TaxID=3350255 RepID=UPI00373E0AEE
MAAVITLLFTLGVLYQLMTPILPKPARAAASVEEIADRLRAFLDEDDAYAPYVTSPGTPLLAWCWPESIETRMPPEGVPAYSGKLLPPEMDEPLEVRFWIASSETAASAVASASRGTEECGRSDGDVLKDVAAFNQGDGLACGYLPLRMPGRRTATKAPGRRSWPRVAGCWPR